MAKANHSALVPEYRLYFNPVPQALKSLGGSATIEELNAKVATDMKLSLAVPHDREHGGRSEFAYRVAWARSYLKVAGLITNSERGVWALTPEGAKVGRVDEKKLARDVQNTVKKSRAPGDDERKSDRSRTRRQAAAPTRRTGSTTFWSFSTRCGRTPSSVSASAYSARAGSSKSG